MEKIKVELFNKDLLTKQKRSQSWILDCWIEEYLTRIRNRENHLKRYSTVNPIEPYRAVRDSVQKELKECKILLARYQQINITRLNKEDKELLARAPGEIQLNITEQKQEEIRTDVKEEKYRDLINAFNWSQYFMSPEKRFEFLDDEYLGFIDKKHEKIEKRNKRRREKYEMENKKKEESLGLIQRKEIPRVKRMLGQVEGIQRMLERPDCNCFEIACQLRSVSTVARRIALFALMRHFKECITKETHYKEKYKIEKMINTLNKELETLKALDLKNFDMSEDILYELEKVSLEKMVEEEEKADNERDELSVSE